MKPDTVPGWSVFKQIFHDHWERFQRYNPRYDRTYYDELVEKMLACGDPKQIGYTAYRCLDCGQCSHIVPMSCKSALCLRCAKVYVDDFVSNLSHRLHEGVIYRQGAKFSWGRTGIAVESKYSVNPSCPSENTGLSQKS